jgi:hypothetical protein
MATERPATSDRNDQPTRVELKPAGAATGYVDGGWWPRSSDPAGEFPGMILALHERIGLVSRVSYNLDGWEPVQRKLTVDGRVVKCEGFHTTNAHIITVVGVNSDRVTLLVVPPATPDAAAQAMLRTAADKDNTATVEDILAGAAKPATPRRTRAAGDGEAEGAGARRNNQPVAKSAR